MTEPAKKGRNAEFLAQAGKGRPKGVPNKTTMLAKDAIARAFDELGGAERLVEWAQESPDNEKVFYTTLLPKLIPVQIAGDPSNPLTVNNNLNVGGLSESALREIAAMGVARQ